MLYLLALLFTFQVFAQYEHCGADYNCYYETKAKRIQEYREKQEAEQERYRAQQLELQEEQLEAVRNQSEIMESELQQLNQRQSRLEDLQNQQLDEMKKVQKAPAGKVQK